MTGDKLYLASCSAWVQSRCNLGTISGRLLLRLARRALARCTAADESELLKAIDQAATFALRKGNAAAPVTALASLSVHGRKG